MKNCIVIMFFAFAVLGCSKHAVRHDVHMEMILPDSAERTELERHEIFIMPAPLHDVAPVFPSDFNDSSVHFPVCVEVVISEDGGVSEVSGLESESGCSALSDTLGRTLYRQVEMAVKQWSFIGAAICTYVDSEDECSSDNATLRPVAVKLAYRFEFSMVGGKANVVSRELRRRGD